MKLKHRNLKLESKTWNWNLKLNLEIETWSWNMKLRHEIETWYLNLKLKLEIETWNQNLKLRIFCLHRPQLGPFFAYTDNQLWFCKYSPIFYLFLVCPYLGPLLHFYGPFWVISFCPMGLYLGSRSGSKTLSEPTNVDDQFLFWKCIPIFLFLIRPNFGPFCTFWALQSYFFGLLGLFWGRGQVQKLFWNLLM